MFVEGKIPVDRHLRFHCFRPFSSDYEARKLKFFESCKTGLNFAEVDKKSAKKKNIFLFAVEKFSHGLFLSDDVTMRMPHMTLLLLSPNK